MSKANRSDIKPRINVPFHGKSIACLGPEPDDYTEYWVVLKPTCERFGLSYRGQLKKIQEDPNAVAHLRYTTGSDGKAYQMVTIDSRTFKAWLSGIDLSQIHATQDVKDWLVRFKLEASIIVDRFFRGPDLEYTPQGPNAALEKEIVDLKAQLHGDRRAGAELGPDERVKLGMLWADLRSVVTHVIRGGRFPVSQTPCPRFMPQE